MYRVYENVIYSNLKNFNQMAFIVGPRQVGKTTIAKQLQLHFKDSLYLNFDSLQDRQMIVSGQSFVEKIFPPNILREEKPLIIFDEIHKYSKWKNYIKGFYDLYQEHYSIVVTGSARLDIYQSGGDSLMGRYFQYRIHPLTVSELQERNTSNSELFLMPKQLSDLEFNALYKYGGFPDAYKNKSDQFFNLWQANRFKQLLHEDIRSISNLQEVYLLELLAEILKSQSASMVNYSNLAKKINVTGQTVSRWLSILDRFYYCFTIQPWFKNVNRSLTKEPKVYLWDWSIVEDEGARIENFIASHLLKFVHFYTDLGVGQFGLYYLRDLEKREVDFVVTKNNQPLFIIESKASDTHLSKALNYFCSQINVEYTLQSVFKLDYVNKNCFSSKNPLVVPTKTLLSQLI